MATTPSRESNAVHTSRVSTYRNLDMPSAITPKPTLAHYAQACAALLWLVQAWAMASAVDDVARQHVGQDTFVFDLVIRAALVVALAGMARAVLDSWAQRRIYWQARGFLSALRAQVSQALCTQSPLDKARAPSGVAASMLAEQAEAIVPWLSRYMPAQFRVALVPPCILLAVTFHSWMAALVLLAAAPLIPLFMAIVGWRAQAASEAQMEETGRLSGFLLDRLRGLSTLRAMHAVDATTEQVQQTGRALKERTMRVLRIAFLSSAVLELFSALGVAMVAVYVGFHLLGKLPFGAWGHTLSLGEGLFVLMLAPSFFEPLRDLSAAWHDRASGRAALENLRQLCTPATPLVGARDEPSPQPHRVAPPATHAIHQRAGMSVNIHDLHFSHADGETVFAGLNLHIAAGEHVALTGSSGSGKSVLLALLAGLARAQRGHILLDGQALDEDSAHTLRRCIAWMGQKPHIFTGTVQGNILLGRPPQAAPHLSERLRATGISSAIARLPMHILGEGGIGVSGGEAARLALARIAAQEDASLVLLDEPTAHLDSETAAQVIAAIQTMVQDKTLIVATHDPALMAGMNRCIDLPTCQRREAPPSAPQPLSA